MTESMDSRVTGPEQSDRKVSRHNFIGWIIKGGLLTTLTGMLLPALAYVWPATKKGPATGMQEVASLDDIPEGGAKKVVLGSSALILVRTPETVKAFSAICTHLGCIVDWDEEQHRFVCPCHGGAFDLTGRVIAGPPPRPLPAYAVHVVNGKIYVTA